MLWFLFSLFNKQHFEQHKQIGKQTTKLEIIQHFSCVLFSVHVHVHVRLMFLYIGKLLKVTSWYKVCRIFIFYVPFESILIYIKVHPWHEWTSVLDQNVLVLCWGFHWQYCIFVSWVVRRITTFNLKILQMIRNKVERHKRVLIKPFVTLTLSTKINSCKTKNSKYKYSTRP